MISSRFATAVYVVLLLTLVPTVLHNYIGLTSDDGLTTVAISTTLSGFASAPTDRLPIWGQEILGSHDWIERHYFTSGGGRILLFVGRSFDPKSLYHHPELALLRGVDLFEAGASKLPSFGGAPVHLLRGRSGVGLAAYVLQHGDEFVADPIAFQLRTSWTLLFGPRRAMTLFFAYDGSLPRDAEFEVTEAARVLDGAIESFHAQTRVPGKQVKAVSHSRFFPN